MIADEFAFASIRILGQKLRAREFSALELAEFFLNRVEIIGRKLNAVVTVTRELALEQARRADRELADGKDRGPLHGIPYGAKDLLATRGIPTSWGAAPLKEQMFDDDATVIARLQNAGAVLVAKLAMVEIAGGMGYEQANATFTGPGLNPWDPSRWAGGVVERLRRRRRRGDRAVGHRFGNVGLHHDAGWLLRRHRVASHLWARQSPWGDGAQLDNGQARPAGPYGR
jgi:aspartyl-tRNA(Asn)/glutamyl-tRNA(Gln) amidotransferase subunit A